MFRFYDNIKITLQNISRRYETLYEAKIAFICLRIYGRRCLPTLKYDLLVTFLERVQAILHKWGFCYVTMVLFLHVFTSSAVEAEHSIVTRTKNGGFGLGATSKRRLLLMPSVLLTRRLLQRLSAQLPDRRPPPLFSPASQLLVVSLFVLVLAILLILWGRREFRGKNRYSSIFF
jgi:hypothetical protein